MFKFDFSKEHALHNDSNSDSYPPNLDLQWLPSKELFVSDEMAQMYNKSTDTVTITVGSEELLCLKPSTLFNSINSGSRILDESISFAEKNHSDLIPSKYEGGFKIWECTHDIATFLDPTQLAGKAMLDLGCGVGLLGILALKHGADTVHFQDYNSDVLQYSTIPNVLLNIDSQLMSKCQFFSGDWTSFSDLSKTKYDFIVTSETIYNPANLVKLHDCIQRVLKPSGTVVLGAKSYYFGVGGSTRQFEQLVRSKDVFDIEVVWKCSTGVQREILLMRFKPTM